MSLPYRSHRFPAGKKIAGSRSQFLLHVSHYRECFSRLWLKPRGPILNLVSPLPRGGQGDKKRRARGQSCWFSGRVLPLPLRRWREAGTLRFTFYNGAVVMKNFVIAVGVAAIFAAAGSACAQPPTAAEAVPGVVVDGTPVVSSGRYIQPRRQIQSSRQDGILSNLIELERRKNAWLKRTFLGR